jgi:amino acid permease
MSELDWRPHKSAKKNSSIISLDKQDNNLNPNDKRPSYLARGLLIFTTQMSAFIIPFAVTTDAGIVTNFAIITTLICISTYSITAFRQVNPHADESNKDLVKKELRGSWRFVLWASMFAQYILYGLLMIFISTEVFSYIVTERSSELMPYLITAASISLFMFLVVLFSLENKFFELSRFTPIVNISFIIYLISICIVHYSSDLKSIEWSRDTM